MCTRLALLGALAAVAVAPHDAPAQEMELPKLGDLSAVSTWEIDPANMGTFLSVAAQIAEAAKQARLEAAYGWTMWQSLFTITLVSPFNRAELDDPQIWMKQFLGTPGEAPLMQAFQEFEAVNLLRTGMEIHQDMPDWGYMPAGMTQPPLTWVHIHEFWLKSGQANFAKWNALVTDVVAFFREMNYAYPVWGSMVRYGDGRMVFVTAYDNPADYHGLKGMEAVAAKRGAIDRWRQLQWRMGEVTLRMEDSHFRYLPAQSYMGVPAAQPAGK